MPDDTCSDNRPKRLNQTPNAQVCHAERSPLGRSEASNPAQARRLLKQNGIVQDFVPSCAGHLGARGLGRRFASLCVTGLGLVTVWLWHCLGLSISPPP
jgi:hypothetical protein